MVLSAAEASFIQIFSLAGKSLKFETQGSRTRLHGDDSIQTLALVLDTAFLHSPDDLLRSLITRTGSSFEGVASFGFHQEHPDEIPQGKVSVDYMDDNSLLDEQVFCDVALSFVKANLNATGNHALHSKFDLTLKQLEAAGVKIPGFLKEGFQPTRRVDVFDAFAERKSGQQAVKIGEVYTDGHQGQIKVLNPDFQEHLTELFAQPQLVKVGEGLGLANGLRGDVEAGVLEPFQPDTIDHVVHNELANHNFRGVIADLK